MVVLWFLTIDIGPIGQKGRAMGEQYIALTCTSCGKQIKAPAAMAGKKGKCKCGAILSIPDAVETELVSIPQNAEEPQSNVKPIPAANTLPRPPQQLQAHQKPPEVTVNVPEMTMNVKGIKSTNGLGIAALVLGVLAAILCWIPLVGIISIPLAILGLVFGGIGFLIALIGRKSGVGMPISGSIVCIVALVIAIMMTGATVSAIDQAFTPSTATVPVNTMAPTPIEAEDVDLATGPAVVAGAAENAYLSNLELRNIRVADAVLGGKGVFGEVKNLGDRSLKEVEIIVYCLGKDGRPVFEETYYPVLITDSVFSTRDEKPLKPNYSEKFGYGLDDAPSDWSGEVRVEITKVEFAD